MAKPLVSIIINNYNYGRFLGEAIESALAQTYERIEVIVVDDGSEDRSREIIAAFGERIIPILKTNGGQASAFNVGFTASRGDAVIFLDADDVLLPTAADRAVIALDEPGVVKVHWPLEVIDVSGVRTGEIRPHSTLPDGDLHEAVILHGPNSHTFSPTSGNAWKRVLLNRLLPMPEKPFRISADAYLCDLAALLGRVRRIMQPLSLYRLHGTNSYASLSSSDRIAEYISRFDVRCTVLADTCKELAIEADLNEWRNSSWMWQLSQSLDEITSVVPPGDSFILVDEEQLGLAGQLAGRKCIPFLERGGTYWGAPPDSHAAIRALESLRQQGASFIVFVPPALWWLDHYVQLHTHLRVHYQQLGTSERMVVFDLRPRTIQPENGSYSYPARNSKDHCSP